ncbi:hypothetical protein HPB50_005268 [Hyalomma asiaticum]|uniref:Uncharacterized protein n=1 Tax=Hyalomma asiaticum TaxID=266040 RepID=A0ACB7T3H6_HYAAI|nr:hypothetical protein HPB50_005268 [Hyalomma asiaticum]
MSSAVPFYDYVIFLGLTALSLGTGLYLSLRRNGRASTRDEAFLGSRTLHAIPLALSMVASSVSAVGMIGFVAYYYQYGFHTLWCIPTFIPGGLLVSYLILPVLYELKVVPYYINKSASSIEGFRGLFLAGLISASISSSSRLTQLGLDHSQESSSSPFSSLGPTGSGYNGINDGTFFFQGTAVAALGIFVLQIWQTTGRFFSRITPARMTYSLDRCPGNYTLHEEALPGNHENVNALLLYRLSPYWCSLITACLTVLLGLSFSLLFASSDDDISVAARLSSPLVFKLWRRFGLLRRITNAELSQPQSFHQPSTSQCLAWEAEEEEMTEDVAKRGEASKTVGRSGPLEIQPLRMEDEDNVTTLRAINGDIRLQPMLSCCLEDETPVEEEKATINCQEILTVT